jgi:hypothetical protein
MDEVLKVALTRPLVPLSDEPEQGGDFQPPLGSAAASGDSSDLQQDSVMY